MSFPRTQLARGERAAQGWSVRHTAVWPSQSALVAPRAPSSLRLPPRPLLLQPLEPRPRSVSMDVPGPVPVLSFSCDWTHTTCGSVSMFLTKHPVFQVPLCWTWSLTPPPALTLDYPLVPPQTLGGLPAVRGAKCAVNMHGPQLCVDAGACVSLRRHPQRGCWAQRHFPRVHKPVPQSRCPT